MKAKVKKFMENLQSFSVTEKKCSSEVDVKLLEKFPVADLNIEEPAIEDIIREVFTGKDVA